MRKGFFKESSDDESFPRKSNISLTGNLCESCHKGNEIDFEMFI